MEEGTGLLSPPPGPRSTTDQIFPQNDFPFQNMTQIITTGLAAIMTLITFILGIYRGVVAEYYGGTYFMLAFSFLLQVVLQSLMITYGRKGDLAGDKSKFVYIFAGITLLQSVFYDIALFS